MNEQLKVGLQYTIEKTIVFDDTAAAFGSGLVAVFATPSMVALMEKTCLNSVQPFLGQGFTTVGTAVDIRHVKATPVGMKVTSNSMLTAIEGKKLTFKLEVFDEQGLIGTGTHKRYVVNNEDFMRSIEPSN